MHPLFNFDPEALLSPWVYTAGLYNVPLPDKYIFRSQSRISKQWWFFSVTFYQNCLMCIIIYPSKKFLKHISFKKHVQDVFIGSGILSSNFFSAS